MRRRNLLIALLLVTTVGGGFAQKDVRRQPERNVLGIEHVKQLLLVMNTDKRGKISKQQWMAFMEAEFDRLDVTKKGELDQTAIRQSMSSSQAGPFLRPRAVMTARSSQSALPPPP